MLFGGFLSLPIRGWSRYSSCVDVGAVLWEFYEGLTWGAKVL